MQPRQVSGTKRVRGKAFEGVCEGGIMADHKLSVGKREDCVL